jgi:hypothetical protein
MLKKPNRKRLNLENGVIFQGFWLTLQASSLHRGSTALPQSSSISRGNIDDLKKSFESFQSKIQAVGLKAKRKKLQNFRQMTIHDMFN